VKMREMRRDEEHTVFYDAGWVRDVRKFYTSPEENERLSSK
jgi:hypothetical protein